MVIAAGKADSGTHEATTTTTTKTTETTTEMEMVPERSRTSLHNFTTLPCFKWGKRKQLRCVKDPLDPDYPTSSSSSPNRSAGFLTPDRNRRSPDSGGGGGIEAVREKLMLDLRTEVHQMKTAILTGKKPGDLEPRPWNLRTRRAVCKEPNNNNGNSGLGGDRKVVGLSPARNSEVKSPMRGYEVDDEQQRKKGPRAKFSVSLSKQEIEEDFLAILGTRPARRPKKRPRLVQKTVDAVFPGYWLTEITADMYKVNEVPEPSNKR